MSLKRRLANVERQHGIGVSITIHIIWSGKDEEHWRKRAELAKEKGWGIKIIRITVTHVAQTKNEAEVLVKEHRATGNKWTPIAVHSRAKGNEILAEWDPGLPDWLENPRVEEQQ